MPGFSSAPGKIKDPAGFLFISDRYRLNGSFAFHDDTSIGTQKCQPFPKFGKQVAKAGIGSSAGQNNPNTQIQKSPDHFRNLGSRFRSCLRQKRSVNICHDHLNHFLHSGNLP